MQNQNWKYLIYQVLKLPDLSGSFTAMRQTEPKTFLIVDDHKLIVTGITQLIKLDFPRAIIYTALHGQEALEKLKEVPIDITFLDISMPVMDGYQTFSLIKKNYPETRVILLTLLTHESIVHHFMQLGVRAILLKQNTQELATAIRSVWETSIYLPEDIRKIMEKNLSIEPGKIPISSRYRSIIRFISEGKSSKEMASLLFLSKNTINSYRQELLRVTRTKNTDELVAYAFQTGLLH